MCDTLVLTCHFAKVLQDAFPGLVLWNGAHKQSVVGYRDADTQIFPWPDLIIITLKDKRGDIFQNTYFSSKSALNKKVSQITQLDLLYYRKGFLNCPRNSIRPFSVRCKSVSVGCFADSRV